MLMWFRKKAAAKLECITPDEQRLAFAHLESNGWRFDNLYYNFDAWIDYGLGVFVRGKQKIRYEWVLYLDGTFSGEADLIAEIRRVIGRDVGSGDER